MALKTIAEEYFSTINPIAARICQDLDEIKASYEGLWATLTEDQQAQILNESIIKPEVSIKYTPSSKGNRKSEYAVKLVIDDHCSYRDEHSGPFSFRTQSQRDLSIVEKEHKNVVKPQAKKNSVVYLEDNILEVKIEHDTSELPRTGLDFLDNW